MGVSFRFDLCREWSVLFFDRFFEGLGVGIGFFVIAVCYF